MKYVRLLIILVLILSCGVLSAAADSDIRIIADGKLIDCDVPPVIIEGRTLVPIRAIAEAAGADVTWDGKKRQVYIESGNDEMYLKIDSKTATVNGKSKTLDVSCTIISGRTMVPIRFVAESFNYNVSWNEAERIVNITSMSEKVMFSTVGTANVEGGFRVTVKFNSGMRGDYKISKLTNPDRLVLDVENAQIDYSRQFNFENDVVKDVRAANHDSYLRFTFDLTEAAKYKTYVNNAKDAIVITFSVPTKGEITEPGDDDEKEEKKEKEDDGIFTIVIDAGHGGSDPGALGKEDGEVVARESEINLDVALKTVKILKDKGYNVVTTRTSDKTVSLGGRCKIANDADAELFISIHSNAMGEGREEVNGTMVFYGAEKDKEKPWVPSKTLASNILGYLYKALETENLGIQVGDELAVIRGTDAPAVLVELAFITNVDDREKLMDEDYRQKAAEAIANGIIKTINGK